MEISRQKAKQYTAWLRAFCLEIGTDIQTEYDTFTWVNEEGQGEGVITSPEDDKDKRYFGQH